MALETATYISDLVSTNPTASDNISQGDDHIRLLKSTLKSTFPNITGAVTPSHTTLNFMDATSSVQTQLNAKAPSASPTLTGTVTISGTLTGTGVSTYLASPPAIGSTTPSTGAFTTLTTSGDIVMSGTGQLDLPAGTTAQRSATPSTGMIRYNTTLSAFEGYGALGWAAIGGGGGATGGGTDAVFYNNGKTVTTSYSIPSGQNSLSTGPITVNSGVTVTVPSGSRWVVL